LKRLYLKLRLDLHVRRRNFARTVVADCKAVICAEPLEAQLMSSLLSLIFFPLLEFGSERFIVFQMQLSKNIFRFDSARGKREITKEDKRGCIVAAAKNRKVYLRHRTATSSRAREGGGGEKKRRREIAIAAGFSRSEFSR